MLAHPSPLRRSFSARLRFALVLTAVTMSVPIPLAAQELLASLGPREQLGAWSVAPLPPEKDRMQAVHATLLPNGKILIVNGSSLRLQTVNNPVLPFTLVDTKNDQVTDNTGLFDPGIYTTEEESTPSTFTKITSPPNPVDGKANDLFCGGHLQTPNGDILFVSGTDQYYGLKRLVPPSFQVWTGSVFANLFDWQSESWKVVGELQDGHWYPTLLPLADGRIAAISGWSSEFDTTGGRPIGKMSTWMEFYDWNTPEKPLTAVDLKGLADGPFTPPNALDHYPRIHALQDGRFLITGDGSGGGRDDTYTTSFMTIEPPAAVAPPVSFTLAAERTAPRRIYGTAVVDPNSPNGDVLLIGGQLATEDALIGPNNPPKDLANAVTTQMERFTPPTVDAPDGAWEVIPDFIGDRQTDARSNHFATLLPNKQLLIMGGGRYRFYSPNFQPLLLTPDPSAPGGYHRTTMNPGTQPRLYHNTALLLPDGRIFMAGGNASYAVRDDKPEGGFDVLLNTYYKKNPLLGIFIPSFVDEGTYAISAENYQVEFFYPPYLFSPGPRPKINGFVPARGSGSSTSITYGTSYTVSVSDMTPTASLVLMKLGAATHGWDQGQRLADLKFSQDLDNRQVTFEAPSADQRHLSPPAYYMIFYVNNVGYPSVAKIVRLEMPPA